MNTIIRKIIENKIRELEALSAVTPLGVLKERVSVRKLRSPSFLTAVVRAGTLSFVKEIKRASIVRGLLVHDYNPLAIAKKAYTEGAHAISVCTERAYHMGADADVTFIRDNIFIPVMYRDYIIDKYQLYHARCLGAAAA
ncbi:MAG: hypothetical protein LBS99_00950, partial [Clostridiales bacterium]|nr:hypothetical protein [Clostridiales bacterium]